jgi:oxalate decarboxylase
VSDQNENNSVADLSRRNFLGVSSTALATAALAGITAHAQEMQDTHKAEKDISASNPGQENNPLLTENPSSNMPPPTALVSSALRTSRKCARTRRRRMTCPVSI